jgi:hypothetical protein
MSINILNRLHNKYGGITDFNLLSFSLTDNPTKSLIKNGVKLNPNNWLTNVIVVSNKDNTPYSLDVRQFVTSAKNKKLVIIDNDLII